VDEGDALVLGSKIKKTYSHNLATLIDDMSVAPGHEVDEGDALVLGRPHFFELQ
jgi:diphthamide synthase (EF-2-diphthine--ammonia ligase)